MSRPPCPKCGGEGSFAYDCICFKCDYKVKKSQPRLHLSRKSVLPNSKFPIEDPQSPIPDEYLKWLEQYFDSVLLCGSSAYINLKEEAFWVYYSKEYDRLVFPYAPGAWCARSNIQKPKWLISRVRTTYGNKWIYGSMLLLKQDPVILVEDIISALKIQQNHSVICLFGTSLNQEFAHDICATMSEVIIWLDNDAAGRRGSEKIYNQLQLKVKCSILRTEFDPKCYSIDKIQEHINAKT